MTAFILPESAMRPVTLIALTAFAALVLAGGALLAFGWLGRGGDSGGDPVLITAGDAESLASGEALYAEHCASCHGADLAGQPNWRDANAQGRRPAPPHDESGHTWHHPDAILFAMTKYGVEPFAPPGYESDMPAFEGVLDDAAIVAVLAYIMSTWPDAIRARQRRMSEQMQEPPPRPARN